MGKEHECGSCVHLSAPRNGRRSRCEKYNTLLAVWRAPYEERYRAQRAFQCVVNGGKEVEDNE